MTDTSAEALAKLLDGVTPGPWRVTTDPCHYDTASDVQSADGVLFASVGGTARWKEQESNTRFIAAARELVPALAARVAELESLLAGRTFTVDEGREWKARAARDAVKQAKEAED
jgi:hypothetical protein